MHDPDAPPARVPRLTLGMTAQWPTFRRDRPSPGLWPPSPRWTRGEGQSTRELPFVALLPASSGEKVPKADEGRARLKFRPLACHPERESRDLGGRGAQLIPHAPPAQVPRLTLGMTVRGRSVSAMALTLGEI